jgi:hypothetical protein
MKVQLVTPHRVSHLQRYGITVRGNVTSVYPPLMSNFWRAAQATCTSRAVDIPLLDRDVSTGYDYGIVYEGSP